jgi:sn-glycerol 3-phosphate transport system substrate-binding protein
MATNINRRSFLKGTAGAAALGAASSTFFAPSLISAQGSDTEVILWTAFGSGVNGETQARFVEEYNAQGNGVTVTSSVYPSYEELANAILTGLPSGDIPDVAVVSDVWWFPLYLRGALADVSAMVDTPEDYQESLFVEYQRQGGQFGVPFARSTPLFYFNREAVEAAGLDESIFATWETFRENAPALVEAGGVDGSFGFGSAAEYGAWFLHGAVWGFGGRYSDEEFNILIDEGGAVDAGEFMREFVQNYGALAVNDPAADFQTGSLGAVIASTGSLGGITAGAQMDFGTAKLPEGPEGFGCPTGGSGLSIMADAADEQKEAAMDFITFCTNTEKAADWAMSTGYMPVRTSAVESEEYQTFLEENPRNQVAVDQLPLTQPQDSARVFVPNGDQIIGRGWEQILVNNVPAADAFADVAATLEEEAQPVVEAIAAIEG